MRPCPGSAVDIPSPLRLIYQPVHDHEGRKGARVTISAFDLFKVGIGPSSSHTVGPMLAAATFVSRLAEEGLLERVAGVRCELCGPLGATGHGHGSVKAVVLGLEGERPDIVDPV